MEKVTDTPLGGKFLRQSAELAAIEAKLKRPIPPNRRKALEGARVVLSGAIQRTMVAISAPSWSP